MSRHAQRTPAAEPEHLHAWERCETCDNGDLVCVNHPVPFPHQDPDATSDRIAHSFAVKYGLREKLTYQQAQRLEAALTLHLIAWLHR